MGFRRADYDLFSHVYDRVIALHSGDANAAARDYLVDRAGVEEGSRVLDLCTGTGAVALRAQRTTGRDGFVVGLDFSGGMIRKAQEKAGLMHLKSVAFVVGDAARLPFAAGSFDVVSCSHAMYERIPIFGSGPIPRLGSVAVRRRARGGRGGAGGVSAPLDRRRSSASSART